MSKLQRILEALDQNNIDRDIVTPSRMAEHSYRSIFLRPNSYDEFTQECANYWNHLHCYYYHVSKTYSNSQAFGIAMNKINQALGNKGGLRMAYEKAQKETFGHVKGIITSVFISEVMENYIGSVLRTFINPYDYNERYQLMKEYVALMNLNDISEGDFQQMVSHFEVVIRSHVKHHFQMDQDRKFGVMMN